MVVDGDNKTTKGKTMKELLIFAGIFGAWFALQLWVLPRFGVNT